MVETNPRLSLGLPVYNGANYLRETLDSLLAQTFGDWQLLVSDNGSSDATMDIVRDYAAADRRITFQQHPENIGAHRNYNSIVPHATGEYFKWLAHDDLLAPTFLERCVEILDTRPEVVLAFTAVRRIDEEGNAIDELRSKSNYESDSPYVRLRAYVGDRLKAPPIFGVMRRSTLTETALLRSYGASDFTFLEEMAMRGRFGYVDEPLFLYRIHTQRHSAGTTAEQVQWYHPDRKAPMMTRWLELGGLLDSIRRVPMSLGDKVRSFAFAGWWALRHGRGLADDAWTRGKYEAGRLGAKLSRTRS